MNTTTQRALAGALVAACLGLGAGSAHAATATIQNGTLEVAGDGAEDAIVLRHQSGSVTGIEIDFGGDGGDFLFDSASFSAIDIDSGRGNDIIHVVGCYPGKAITLYAGAGADTLLGGCNAETLYGGAGPDRVSGRDGNDEVLAGDGDDRVVWNPGDDSDVVDGQGGRDVLQFEGAGVSEVIAASANGARLTLTRDIAAVAMDVGTVERLELHAWGGADTVTIGDLTGTPLTAADIDLTPFGSGDGAADHIHLRGTTGADQIEATSRLGEVAVSGLATRLRVTGGEPDLDHVHVDGREGADAIRYPGTAAADTFSIVADGTEVAVIEPSQTLVESAAVESVSVLGLAGGDTITSVGNLAALTALTIDGGDGEDTLSGGNGGDVINGGHGNDQVDGQQGADRIRLGRDDDRFKWDPGDGNDAVDGEPGVDVLEFSASGASEDLDVTAAGKRALIHRDVGNVVTDTGGFEQVLVRARGGSDVIRVGDLAPTGIGAVDVDLLDAGAGDGLADLVVIEGTAASDIVSVTRSDQSVLATGLAARTSIAGGEAGLDALLVRTLGGDDDVTVASDVAGVLNTTVDLGSDD